MPYFQTREELREAIGGLMERCSTNAELGPKISSINSIIQFVFHNPEDSFIIDSKNDPIQPSFFSVVYDIDIDTSLPDILMEMDCDVAHSVFSGELSLNKALLSSQIKYKGNIKPLLKLNGVLSTLQKIYSRHLDQIKKRKTT